MLFCSDSTVEVVEMGNVGVVAATVAEVMSVEVVEMSNVEVVAATVAEVMLVLSNEDAKGLKLGRESPLTFKYPIASATCIFVPRRNNTIEPGRASEHSTLKPCWLSFVVHFCKNVVFLFPISLLKSPVSEIDSSTIEGFETGEVTEPVMVLLVLLMATLPIVIVVV